MAKVVSPLQSQSASGKFGGSIVFGRRKGANVVRSLVIPANPNTEAQKINRRAFAVAGRIARRVGVARLGYAAETDSIVDFYRKSAVGENVWNSQLGRGILGPGNATWIATRAQFDALSASDKSDWETAATSSLIGFSAYARDGVTISAGEHLFHLQKELAGAGYGGAFDETSPAAMVAKS